MSTSAEQLHNKEFNTHPNPGKDKRLFIDLDICSSGECKDCVIQCSYLYHQHPAKEGINDNGILSVVELATYALVCRRCEEPHCVHACPVEALEQ